MHIVVVSSGRYVIYILIVPCKQVLPEMLFFFNTLFETVVESLSETRK
jgi:hypothetical protein